MTDDKQPISSIPEPVPVMQAPAPLDPFRAMRHEMDQVFNRHRQA